MRSSTSSAILTFRTSPITQVNDVLHIGLHKTGSTYLQNVIWPQVNNVQYLSRPFTQHNHAFNMLQYADDSLYREADVRSVLEAFDTGRFLIADESLSGKPVLFGSINRSLIARRLRSLFPEATVVLFIRDQREILLSHYHSYVKEPIGIKTLKEFLWRPGADYSFEEGVREGDYYEPANLYYNTSDFHLHLDSFLYSHLVNLYLGLFERVEIFLYEDLRQRPSAVLERLSEIVGQELVPAGDRMNRSYSRVELVIRRSLNRVRPIVDSDIMVKGASRVLGTLLPDGNKAVWRRQIDDLVGDYYSEDNALLKQLCPDIPWDLYGDQYV